MPFYQETLDWSVVGDVRDALQAISDVQRIDVKDLQREMDSMEDLPRWAQCSAQFGSADVGTFLRYSGNIGDSVSGLVCSGYNRESGYRTILRELVRHGHECLRQALSTDIEAPLVLSHRDTGIPNFRKDGAGQLVLIDWEHCRIDNPLSDYTHLWLQLAGDDLDESAATVFEFIKDRFSEKAWFDVTLRLCVAEKFLGNTNHKVTYSKTAEAAVRAVSAGLERMEWALAEVNG